MLGLCWVALLGMACVPWLRGQGPKNDPGEIEQRVDQLMGKLTVEEKFAVLGGDRRFLYPSAAIDQNACDQDERWSLRCAHLGSFDCLCRRFFAGCGMGSGGGGERGTQYGS